MTESRTFPATSEDFGSLNEATAWLKARGFSAGALQAGAPHIGIMFGNVDVRKWKDLSAEDLNDLHGHLTADGNDYRRGGVTIVIYPGKHSSVLEAFFSDPTGCGAQASVGHRPLIVAEEIA